MPNPYREEQDKAQQRPQYSQPQGSQEYHKGDKTPQIPWWVILIAFCLMSWPVGIALLVINYLLRQGIIPTGQKTGQTNRTETSTPVYAQPDRADTMRKQAENVAKRAEQQAANAAYRARQQAEKRAAAYDPEQTARKEEHIRREKDDTGSRVLMIVGIVLAAIAALSLPDGIAGLMQAMETGGSDAIYMLSDLMTTGTMLFGSVGCLFASWKLRTGHRMRKKISNIVGNAPYMKIQEIADAIPCSYAKCCKHLENCIDKGVFGEDAYLDMRTGTLVVREAPPAPQPAAQQNTQQKQQTAEDEYAKILNQLRDLNNAIPGAEMSDKISRLETVSAKIFAQAQTNPDKLPQMRKFMDYYLPTALKLLKTYAELDAQGVEGENIRESKQRIEQVMDTLVTAFETQLDRLFEDDALDVSTDIDVMENMLRADGLTGETGSSPHLQL